MELTAVRSLSALSFLVKAFEVTPTVARCRIELMSSAQLLGRVGIARSQLSKGKPSLPGRTRLHLLVIDAIPRAEH